VILTYLYAYHVGILEGLTGDFVIILSNGLSGGFVDGFVCSRIGELPNYTRDILPNGMNMKPMHEML